MPEALARIAPSQPNEAMARIVSRKKKVPFHSAINLPALNFRVGF
jgi:hypothetical protein